MTYLDELKKEHSDWDEDKIQRHIENWCPEFKGACPFPSEDMESCVQCWNREIPGTKPTNQTKNNEREENNMNESTPAAIYRKTKADLLKDIAELKKQVEHLDKYEQLEEAADMTAAMCKAYETAGFSREEAFELTKLMIELAAKTGRM